MLAQEWLYGRRAPTQHDYRVERYLKLPTEFNKYSSVVVLNSLAERIVFTDDVPTILYDMHDNKQLTFEGVLTSAKLPYDCFWLEYSTVVGIGDRLDENDIERVSYGALIQRIHGDVVRMHIVVGLHWPNQPVISTLSYIIEFSAWPPVVPSAKHEGKLALAFEVLWAFNFEKLNDIKYKKCMADLGSVVNELIFGIFLVTQPRVYSDEPIRWKNSHKVARAKSNKPPLLEYRRIRLHISKPRKHYTQRPTGSLIVDSSNTDSPEAVQHRRYHKVMGHFRHYVNNDNPHTTWIEPHYRGDPALGVTFTERDVSK